MQNNLLETTENIELLARFDFLDLCLLGETGTGKTHTAKRIHRLSPRADQPFVSVNCAELTPSIIEAELFGHEKGAFTGAISSKPGKFESALGGTLFLDEIGELPKNLQAKLLKVVEEKTITRVGGNRPRSVNTRIFYATNRDLDVLREDLRYRITAHTIHLRPLRERGDREIISLARKFVKDFAKKSKRSIYAPEKSLSQLTKAKWYGNVRELRSFVEKTCLQAVFENESTDKISHKIVLTKEVVEDQLTKQNCRESCKCRKSPEYNLGENMPAYIERIETQLLKQALEANNNNQTRAAKDLGISRGGLIKKLKRLNNNGVL